MRENEERRDDRDEENELQELKRRRNRRDEEDDDRPRGRSHKAQPQIKKFQIWFEFNKSTVTADYETEGDFDASDLEQFVDDLISDDFRLYRKQTYKKERSSGNYDRYSRGGRSNWRGRNYED